MNNNYKDIMTIMTEIIENKNIHNTIIITL